MAECFGPRNAPDAKRLNRSLTKHQVARFVPGLTGLNGNFDRIKAVERYALDLGTERVFHDQPAVRESILPAPGILDADDHAGKAWQPHQEIKCDHEGNRRQGHQPTDRDWHAKHWKPNINRHQPPPKSPERCGRERRPHGHRGHFLKLRRGDTSDRLSHESLKVEGSVEGRKIVVKPISVQNLKVIKGRKVWLGLS